MKQQKGFTLLETLVALMLMSLLIMALFGGFRAGIRSWQTADRHVAWIEEPRQLSALLYRHLSQFVPVPLGRSRLIFNAEAERLLYVAPLAMSVGNEPHLFELLNGHNGRPGLWARFVPLEQTAGRSYLSALDDVEYVQISENLSVQFSYFVDDAWIDALPAGRLPVLVKVNLQVSSGQQWPSLVFAVQRMRR